MASNGFTKEAIGWLAGPLGHIGVNVAGRAAHHGSNLSEILAHKGLQHALTGSQINPITQRVIKAFAGPEVLVPYQAAHALGSKVKDLPTDQIHGALRTALSSTTGGAVGQAVQNAPVLGSLHKALTHEISGSAPTLQSKGLLARMFGGVINKATSVVNTPFDTKLQRVAKGALSAAPAAAAAALDPAGTAAHVGINTAREVLGRSSIGKGVQKTLLDSGLAGNKISPLRETAVDLLASPALLDPHRIGMAAHQAGASNEVRSLLDAASMYKQIKKNPQVLPAPFRGATLNA